MQMSLNSTWPNKHVVDRLLLTTLAYLPYIQCIDHSWLQRFMLQVISYLSDRS